MGAPKTAEAAIHLLHNTSDVCACQKASLRIGDSVARACDHAFVFANVLALNAASLATSREGLCLAPTFVKIR